MTPQENMTYNVLATALRNNGHTVEMPTTGAFMVDEVDVTDLAEGIVEHGHARTIDEAVEYIENYLTEE